jgi:hypothetical protein
MRVCTDVARTFVYVHVRDMYMAYVCMLSPKVCKLNCKTVFNKLPIRIVVLYSIRQLPLQI